MSPVVELLPCPFCGGEAAVSGPDDDRFYVLCTKIDCYCAVGEGYDRDAMPDHSFMEREAAIAAWNKRAAPGEQAIIERCARVAEQVAINAERRAAGHTNAEAKQSAIDKMQGAQEAAAFIRERAAAPASAGGRP